MINREYGMLMITGVPLRHILSLTLQKMKKARPPRGGLTSGEFSYVVQILDAIWVYNYEAAKSGKVGHHALLKSGEHSDVFVEASAVLKYQNLRAIIVSTLLNQSRQMLAIADKFPDFKPDFVAGVPRGATLLAEEVTKLLGAMAKIPGVRNLKMEKVDGRIVLTDELQADSKILFVEDALSKGTGVREAALEIKSKQPKARFLPYTLTFLNRTGVREIMVEGAGVFQIMSCLESPLSYPLPAPIGDFSPPVQIHSWPADQCLLCALGSEPIKPKDPKENWDILKKSQKD